MQIRVSIAVVGAGLGLVCGVFSGAGQAIPVDHPEPMTIRILNGKNGLPLPHLHAILIAGYDDRDIRHQSWREEVFTDISGEARIPKSLVDFAFLQVSLRSAKACQKSARGELYNLDRIRGDGFSAPNYCGIVRVVDAPGVLTIFVKPGSDIIGARTPDAPQIVAEDNPPETAPQGSAVQSPLPASQANEIESLIGHLPGRASDLAPSGTAALPDSYEEMCQPER
jgi:hypothetical protein